MATLNHDSPFQSWNLTPDEFLAGSILTITQKQVLQNQIAQIAIQKNNYFRSRLLESEDLYFFQIPMPKRRVVPTTGSASVSQGTA